MPFTYNGIGTRYVGRKNVEARPGICPHCQRHTNLTSYDTRLCFVVFFLPVLPLARKRIISQCPSCRRHYVMPLDEWEAGKQLSISGAMEEFRRDPSPERAVAAHQQLVAYHQTAQAEEFGQTLATRYADNANVLLYLGEASEHVGRPERAAGYYQAALTLRPDLPAARIAVAAEHRRRNHLDEARALLDFLETPGAARVYSALPLELLANAYQQAGRHQDALDLYAVVLREVPAAGQHAGFRKRMRTSEKALKRGDTVLPEKKFTLASLFGREAGRLRWLTIGGGLFILAVVGGLVSNHYIRGHRTLHLVNGYDQPASVRVEGVTAVTVPPHGHAEIALPEGSYRAAVTGPVTEQVACNLASDYFGRWLDSPAWVLNVGGEAVLFVERVHYARGGGSPPDYSFSTGRGFASFSDVDHPFTELPERVQVDKNQGVKTLTKLDYFRGPVSVVVQQLTLHKRYDDALSLAEDRLRIAPPDDDLLDSYQEAADQSRQTARLRDFLRAGLSRRPVDISWHRFYQGTARTTGRGLVGLRAEYDALLQAEPANAALLYLRGRISDRRAETISYDDRAIRTDPTLFWPHFSLGYEHTMSPDWAAARRELEEARRLAGTPPRTEIESYLFLARLGLRDTAALETELHARLAATPSDGTAMRCLVDVLAAADRPDDARQVLDRWTTRTQQMNKDGALAEAITGVRRDALYSLGAFLTMEVENRLARSPAGRRGCAEALLEQGKVAEAAQILQTVPEDEYTADFLLAVSVAACKAGDVRLGDDHRAQAMRAYQRQGGLGAAPAALLSQANAPALDEVDAPDLSLLTKRLVLASLAWQHRDRAADYARKIAALNVARQFPAHLVLTAAPDPARRAP